MGAELAYGAARDLAAAEAEFDELSGALDRAREATRAAEARLRKRRRREAERLRAYEQACDRAKEAAERQRLARGLTIEERLTALITLDEDETTDLAYEQEWYRVMLQRCQEASREGADAFAAVQ